MTKFVAYYNLCPIHDPKEFLGISPDQTEGNIITTLNKNIIIVIKISTQKQIKSWSVTEKLTTKVVFDKQSQRYIGVFGNRALRCWDEACEDVNKCKKLKFKKSIADLVVVDDKIYVLYSEGSCELLAQAIESRKEQTNENQNPLPLMQPKIFDTKGFKLQNGQEYLTYFERQHEDARLELVFLTLLDGRGTDFKRYKIARPSQPDFELKPTGYAVVESDEGLMLMTIWNDSNIFMLNLDEYDEQKTSWGKFASRMLALKVENRMSVLGVTRNIVAIYGANSGQEGASLLLYNTKFQVVKTKQFFKVYLDFSRLWNVGQYILLAMGQNLSVVTYIQSPDLLADLLGTQTNNNFDKQITNEDLYEEEEIQDNIQFVDVDIDPITDIRSEIMTSLPDTFSDGLQAPFEDVDNFDRALIELNRFEMSTKVVEVEHALEDLQIVFMSNFNDTGFRTPEVQLIAQQLENCGASEFEITEKLLTLLIKTNLLTDIVICLRRYSNISDIMLVKLLSYVLKLRQKAKTQSTPISTSLDYILKAVFSCNFNPENIALHLRKEIDYESVVFLIGYLYDLLEDSTVDAYPIIPTVRGDISDGVQYEMKLIKWFSVLLSSHFQKLALSKDTDLKELLLKWQSLCISSKELMDDLQETAELLYNVVDKKELSKEITSKWYTIEEVCLW